MNPTMLINPLYFSYLSGMYTVQMLTACLFLGFAVTIAATIAALAGAGQWPSTPRPASGVNTTDRLQLPRSPCRHPHQSPRSSSSSIASSAIS